MVRTIAKILLTLTLLIVEDVQALDEPADYDLNCCMSQLRLGWICMFIPRQ